MSNYDPIAAQREFDAKYITSTDIADLVGVGRGAILCAVRSGRLPEPITIHKPNGDVRLMLFLREQVDHIIVQWVAKRGADK